MARMYSRKKGKSGSDKPVKKSAPWLDYTKKEIKELILKLAEQGHQSAEIGAILRDKYGIPTTRIKDIKISQVLKENNKYPKVPEDLYNLLQKAVHLDSHLKKNKRDYISKRSMELTESKIRRLAKYYKKKGRLPEDWKYDIDQVKLLVK